MLLWLELLLLLFEPTSTLQTTSDYMHRFLFAVSLVLSGFVPVAPLTSLSGGVATCSKGSPTTQSMLSSILSRLVARQVILSEGIFDKTAARDYNRSSNCRIPSDKTIFLSINSYVCWCFIFICRCGTLVPIIPFKLKRSLESIHVRYGRYYQSYLDS